MKTYNTIGQAREAGGETWINGADVLPHAISHSEARDEKFISIFLMPRGEYPAEYAVVFVQRDKYPHKDQVSRIFYGIYGRRKEMI